MGIRHRLKLGHGSQDKTGVVDIKFSKNDTNIRKLGEGISGKVELFQCKKSSHQYVIKTYHCKETYESKKEYKERVLQEYRTLSVIDNVNFIQVYKQETSFDGLTVRVYLHAGSNDLYQLMKPLRPERINPDEMLCFWKQMCNGISYLHSNANMCHRDIKLDNLVIDLDLGLLKIIDLVTAVSCDKDSIGIVGSNRYLSPETIQHIYYDGKKCDIWSMGIVLYYMLNKKFPWKSARLDDQKYLAFKKFDITSPDDYKDASTLPPPVLEDELEIGVESVLRWLPADSIGLTSQIFQIDPVKRSSIEDFFTNQWFKDIECCDENSKCSIKHTYLQ